MVIATEALSYMPRTPIRGGLRVFSFPKAATREYLRDNFDIKQLAPRIYYQESE